MKYTVGYFANQFIYFTAKTSFPQKKLLKRNKFIFHYIFNKTIVFTEVSRKYID